MDTLLSLLVLLLAARLLGAAAVRLGQPAAAGELMAGIVLATAIIWFGPTIPFLIEIRDSPAVGFMAEAAIFFLLLYAGVELKPTELASHSRASMAVALGGAAAPFILGFLVAWSLLPDQPARFAQSLLVAIALSITAIPATVKIFTEFGLLHMPAGRIVVSAAVFDDVIGLFMLAVLGTMIGLGESEDGLWLLFFTLTKAATFFAVTIVLGVHVYPRVSRHLRALEAASLELSALVIVALAYGAFAEWLGLHWILGALVAGLFFEPARVGLRAYNEVKLITGALTTGVLGPVFFAWIGLGVDLRAFWAVPGFVLLLFLAAFLGKLVGAGLPAYISGLSPRLATAVGVGMSARGAVELVVIAVAARAGIFEIGRGTPSTDNLYSALVLVAVATTLIAPIALQYILRASKN